MQKNNHIARFFSASQRTSGSKSLDPTSVKIDERSTSELLNYMAKLSKQFWYYNENGHRDGDWSDFFQTDLVSLLALISESYNENEYRNVLSLIDSIKKINSKYHNKPSEDLSEALWELFHLSFKSVFKINDWYQTFTRLHVDTPFHVYLKELIWRKLSFGLRDLYAFYYFSVQAGVLKDKEKVDNEFKKFQMLDVLWNFNPFPNISRSKVDMFHFFKDNDAFLHGLREAVKNLHNYKKSISEEAKIVFGKSLNTKTTEPHIAQILGFLKAYSFQQEAINEILPRHLNFYYKDVLQFENRGAIGDQVFLLMKLGKGENPVNIPKSSQLSAGTDADGKPIIFETSHNLQVTPSIITDYRTLVIDKSKRATDMLRSLTQKGYDQPVINKATGLYESFKMFGETTGSNAVEIDSTIGFAVSSPELCLEGGKRCVEIQFQQNKSSQNTSSINFGKKPGILGDDLIELKITGSKGWFSPDYQEIKVVDGSLRIRLGLKKSSSAVVSYSEKLHGKGYSAVWPIVVLTLKNQADSKGLNPYKVFSKLSFSSYQIKTTTKGLSALSLITDTGKAAAAAVVAPFGGNPSLGSQLIIGCYEAFVKHTKLVKVRLNWLNLPAFSIYYDVYNKYQKAHGEAATFHKESFTCSLAWLNFGTGKWDTSAAEVKVFEGNEEKSLRSACGHPCTSQKSDAPSAISKDKNPITEVNYTYDISVEPNYALKYPLTYSDQSKSGFVSLELTGPDESFGSNLYPKIISEVTLENTIKAAKAARKHKSGGKNSNGNNSQTQSQKSDGDSSSVSKESGLKKWFKKVFGGIGNFFKNKVGPVLKKVGKVLGKFVSPVWGIISKLFKGIFKKNKEDISFQPLPNKPYVPKIKGVSIDYCSSFNVVPGTDEQNKFFKIHPFGIEEINASNGHLLPQYPEEGYVFLGFSQLDKGSTLSVFLGVEDLKKTKITDRNEPLKIEVLGAQKWEKVRLVTDTTLGLKKAGILRVFIDKLPANNNSIMPLKSYWLRISTSGKSVETCKLQMVGNNAVLTDRIINAENTGNDLINVKSGTISGFVNPFPPIGKVEQPFPSFGGGNPESKNVFNQRVSKRISNKDRGVSVSYIESIVLDAFPQIYQVNIHKRKSNSIDDPNVRVAILTSSGADGQLNPYLPVAPINLLNEVRELLRLKVSPHVKLEVEHMQFDKVHVSLEAIFCESQDGKSLKDELNADLKDFLSPWILDNQLAHKRSVLYVNDLLQFIGSRPYISSYENLKIKIGKKPVYGVFHQKKGKKSKEYNEHQLLPNGPSSVLASADAHRIKDVSPIPMDYHQYEIEEATI